MSTIKAANITDGTDTVATGYVVNGSAKSWVNSTQVGTQAIRDSLNISSLTDLGTGRTQTNFATNMANDDFAGSFYQMGAAGENYTNFNNTHTGGFGDKTTSSFKTISWSGSAVDSGVHDIIIMGELA